MTFHRIFNQKNTKGATSGTGTAYLSRGTGFTLGF